MKADLVILGGGLAGMCAAYQATQAGLRPVVVETRGRPGGLIASAKLTGVPFDIGAESWATRSRPVRELVDELGLEVTEPTGRSWVWNQRTERRYPIPDGVLGLPADIDAPEVLTAIGEEGVRRAKEDLTMGAGVAADAEDFATLVRERVGEAVLDHLVRPVAGGIHTADPSRLAVDTIAPGLRGLLAERGSLLEAAAELTASQPKVKVAQTRGGMFRLIETLEERVVAAGGQVLVRHALTGLEPGDWRVTVRPTERGADPAADPIPTGQALTIEAPRVILALPGPVAMQFLATLPGLPTWELPIGAPIAHQVLMIDDDELAGAPCGSGILISDPADAADPSRAISAKAVSHLSHKWGWMREVLPANRNLLRVSYGRADHPYPNPTVEDALADVNAVMGTSVTKDQVVASMLVRWDGQLAPPTPEHRRKVGELEAALEAYPGLAVTGAWVAGSGFAAVVPHARAAARRLA